MFRVTADSLEAHLAFDPGRTADLEQLHAVMRKAAPSLKRHFHAGTPAGEAGMRGGKPLVPFYAGKLDALRTGGNNFSFETFDDLNTPAVAALFAEAADIFKADKENPVRYMQGD